MLPLIAQRSGFRRNVRVQPSRVIPVRFPLATRVRPALIW